MELISRDGEWANVYVDGEFVAAVSSMQPHARLELIAGTHFLEIVDPRTGERWDSGDLDVLSDITLKVGFGREVDLEVHDHPEVWRPR